MQKVILLLAGRTPILVIIFILQQPFTEKFNNTTIYITIPFPNTKLKSQKKSAKGWPRIR